MVRDSTRRWLTVATPAVLHRDARGASTGARRRPAGRRAARGLHGRAVDAPAGGRARRPARRRPPRRAGAPVPLPAPEPAARHPPRQRLHAEPARQPGRAGPDRPRAARRLRHPDRAARPGPTRARHRHARGRARGYGRRAGPHPARRPPPAARAGRHRDGPDGTAGRPHGRAGPDVPARPVRDHRAGPARRRHRHPRLRRHVRARARSSTPTRPPWTPPSCWSGPARWCRPATSRWTVSSAASPARPRPTTSRRSAKPSGSRGSRRWVPGDGATALADWARAHPRAVGRLVLDGPSDPTVDEPDRSEARAKSTEAAFDAFAQRCTSRSTCPLGADPRTAVTALVTRCAPSR